MHLSNNLGKLGELIVSSCFVMEIDRHHAFEVAYLGEKAQVLDFRISLLDLGGKVYGPHFNLQVKARRAPPRNKAIQVGFTPDEVARATAMDVPLYVAVMEELPPRKTKVWVQAVVNSGAGVNSIPRKHSLNSDKTLKKIYGEVAVHFASNKKAPFVSSII